VAGGFEEFFEAATGGTPDAGQAATAVLPWLFRRLVDAPESTPRRLIYVLPANSLPEQVFARIRGWLDRLGRRDEVGTYLLAGAVRDGGWLRHPERTAILVGTHALLLSRALMRGFADSQPGRRTLRQVRRAGRRRDGEQHSAGPAALHQRRNPRLATARLPGYRTGGSGGNTVTVTNPGVNAVARHGFAR
jgi:hypothetical protein